MMASSSGGTEREAEPNASAGIGPDTGAAQVLQHPIVRNGLNSVIDSLILGYLIRNGVRHSNLMSRIVDER